MDKQIDSVCVMAVNRGLLTSGQYAILSEVCSEQTSLDNFMELVVHCNLIKDPEQLAQAVDELTAEEAPAETAEAEPQAGETIPLDVDWFCHYVTERKIIGADVCVCLFSMVEDVTDLLSFAQNLVTMGLTDDFAQIQELVEKSREQAAAGSPPPTSVFPRG